MKIKLNLQKIQTYRYFVLILILCTIVLSPLTARAYQDILTPEQALNRYRAGSLQLSPDNGYIALVVTEPVKGTSSNIDIRIYDIIRSELRQFTTSDKSDRSPRWSPDSEKLYFISGRQGSPQIYAISINGGDYKDVMAGVDYLIEQGLADPERIGIGGWSYDGYMAAWAVTQTKRFKASISGAPITDLTLEYGAETPSINAYDTWYMGTPYENFPCRTDTGLNRDSANDGYKPTPTRG